MKNWKYIEGAKVENGVFSIFKSDKPIKMKSPQGAIVTINPDGTAAHQDKEGSQMAVHPHNSFKEAVEYYKSQGYVKVSNETLGEYMAKKPRVINEEKTGAEEFFKKLSDDVKEREDKDDADIEKVGNAKDKNDKDLKVGDIVDVRGKKGKITKIIGDVIEVFYDNRGTYNPDRIDRHYADEATKVGNFKTGTSQLKPGDKVMSFGKKGTVKEVIGENTDNIYGEPLIKVEFEDGTTKTIGEHYMRKVGNSKVGNSKTGNAYSDKLPTAMDYRKALDEIIEKKNLNPDEARRKYGQFTYAQWEKELGHEIGNSASVDKVLKKAQAEVTYKGYKISYYPFYNAYKITSAPGDLTSPWPYEKFKTVEEAKRIIDREKGRVGNEASDDKFAYVMREFDEGKLKTPDGKVVTDPAQAKAIAYSESKKTENGLARARNAMAKNKKVRNSAVREYKHPDGRVAQIDFNEDGSDADMSIYEGTKEIEQRNFSTIRDAEQYVISHGFRRI